jgi:tRNA A37 threonylcarbamoyladenosine biosynthesis protein TsaE
MQSPQWYDLFITVPFPDTGVTREGTQNVVEQFIAWADAIQFCTLIDHDLCKVIKNIVLKKHVPSDYNRHDGTSIHKNRRGRTYETSSQKNVFPHPSGPKVRIDSTVRVVSPRKFLTCSNRTDSILEQVKSFLGETTLTVESILISGPEGCGKTFFCDVIQRYVSDWNQSLCSDSKRPIEMEPDDADRRKNTTVTCIRPHRTDFVGYHARSTMDRILSLFTFTIERHQGKLVVLLDDIDQLLGCSSSRIEPVNQNRNLVQILFLSIMNLLQELPRPNDLLVIFTSHGDLSDHLNMQNRVHHLFSLKGPANVSTRRDVLTYCLFQDQSSITMESECQQLWCRLLHLTDGYTVSNLIHFSHNILTRFKGLSMDYRFLLNSLQDYDFLDAVKCFSNNLTFDGSNIESKELSHLPLHGQNVQEAWKNMKEIVVTPLCHSRALEQLLYDENEFDNQVQRLNQPRHSMLSGVLLTGPVGSGKSTLAKYCAEFAVSIVPSIRVLNVACTSLVHKELGESERAVKHLFEMARSLSPCMLILDGIETIAAKRGFDNTTEGTMDRLLSTLLVEIDGLIRHDGKVVSVIGITKNRSWVDSALCRPGRLHDNVHLDLPDYSARKCLLESLLHTYKINTSTISPSKIWPRRDLAVYLANVTAQWSAAEIHGMCLESIRIALNEAISMGNVEVNQENFIISLGHIEIALNSVKRSINV